MTYGATRAAQPDDGQSGAAPLSQSAQMLENEKSFRESLLAVPDEERRLAGVRQRGGLVTYAALCFSVAGVALATHMHTATTAAAAAGGDVAVIEDVEHAASATATISGAWSTEAEAVAAADDGPLTMNPSSRRADDDDAAQPALSSGRDGTDPDESSESSSTSSLLATTDDATRPALSKGRDGVDPDDSSDASSSTSALLATTDDASSPPALTSGGGGNSGGINPTAAADAAAAAEATAWLAALAPESNTKKDCLIYKIAWPTRNATDAMGAMERVGVAPTGSPDENCGRLVWGSSLLPGRTADDCAFELHFVEAPELAGADITASWEQFFHESNAGMNEFNAFMHNTVTMYVPHVGPLIEQLHAAGTPYMERKSSSVHGGSAWHHVLVELGSSGRVVEMVGPYVSGGDIADERAVPSWGTHECLEAHQVRYEDSTLLDAYEGEASSDDGTYTPMTIGVSVASSDPVAAAKWFASRGPLTGASVRSVFQSDTCDVVTISWSQAPMMEVRFVHNRAAPAQRLTVGDYELAVSRAHASVLGAGNPGRWDNWLDQHLGLETLFLDTSIPAKRLYDRMVEDLVESASPYAVRETGVSVNIYATNPTTMTFEYTCHTEVAFTNLCLCDEWNNKEFYLNRTGLSDCLATDDDNL